MVTVNDVRRIGQTLENEGIRYTFDTKSNTFTTFTLNNERVKFIFKTIYKDIYKEGDILVVMLKPINAPLAF
jgi:cephalosporin-C deacetylase-like acetyl esterase